MRLSPGPARGGHDRGRRSRRARARASATRARDGCTSSTSTVPSPARRRSDLVERVASAGGLPLQVGGGYRTRELRSRRRSPRAPTASWSARPPSPPPSSPTAAARFGEQLVVAIDVRDGEVAVDGWTRSSGTTAAALARTARRPASARLLVTSTARDGSLAGPDVDLLGEVLLGRAARDRGGRHLVDRRSDRASASSAARPPSRAARCSPGASRSRTRALRPSALTVADRR